jgi:hypothetical protein
MIQAPTGCPDNRGQLAVWTFYALFSWPALS